jgi:hypothetical protein
MDYQIIGDLFGNLDTTGWVLTLDTALSKYLLAKGECNEPNRFGK